MAHQACRHCKERVGNRGRQLCERCHDDPAVLGLYPKQTPGVRRAKTSHCVHCGKPDPRRARSLCHACYTNPAVKALHPPKDRCGRPKSERPVCWCCGFVAAQPTHLESLGWVVRKVYVDGYEMTEVYCLSCFGMWGWPEDWYARHACG